MSLKSTRGDRATQPVFEHVRANLLDIREARHLSLDDLGLRVFHDVPELPVLAAGHKGKRLTCPSCPARTADPMHVVLLVLREIVVEDRCDLLDVDSSGSDISRNKKIDGALAEPGHHTVTLILFHIAVEPLRRVSPGAKLRDDLIDISLGVTEDERSSALAQVKKTGEGLQFLVLTNLEVDLLYQGHGQFAVDRSDLNRVMQIPPREIADLG
ncbi:hypothetical protein DSECCO2_439310 [anaerobic digester metagenome]